MPPVRSQKKANAERCISLLLCKDKTIKRYPQIVKAAKEAKCRCFASAHDMNTKGDENLTDVIG